MQKHLDENKDEHLDMTALECKKVKTELTNTTLALAKVAPKPIFNPPPDTIVNEFERRKEESECCQPSTPMLVATRCAASYMSMD